MKKNRVVVSGLGAVTSLGNSVDEFWQACLGSRTHIEFVPEHWSNYYRAKSNVWSPLSAPDYAAYGMGRADVLRFDPAVLNAIVAAEQAIEDAGLNKRERNSRRGHFCFDGVDPDRFGVFVGTGLGCITSAFTNYVPHLLGGQDHERMFADETTNTSPAVAELKENLRLSPRVSPFSSVQSMANAIAAQISIRYGARGAAETLLYACAAGTAAVGRALRAIQYNELDVAIVGGSEYYGDRAGGVFMAFDRLQALASSDVDVGSINRPFDKKRSGFLFSQGGAGAVILESEEHAAKRGAKPTASIRGMSITADAHSLAAISETDNAIELMFRNLMRDAQIEPAQIDYINAHGTSTLQNDAIESAILERLFPHGPYINSTKGLLGHTIAASGVLELIVTIKSMRDSAVHACKNLHDPVRDLNFPRDRVDAPIAMAISHSFGFGGHNAGLVVENLDA